MSQRTYLDGTYILTELLKGNYAVDDSPALTRELAGRVAELERELRMYYRADGTAIECESIEVAKQLRLQAAQQLSSGAGPTWHTNKLVPPPGAADKRIIAVLHDGQVRSGWIHVSGKTIGQMYLVESSSKQAPVLGIPWENIGAWTYAPEGA